MDPENMSEADLRRALKKMLVDTSRLTDREALVKKFQQYATPAQAPAAAARPRPAAGRPATGGGGGKRQPSAAAAHGQYINGRYVPPPAGPLDGVGGWKVALVVVLASGAFFSPQFSSDPESDSMGARGNEYAYTADDVNTALDGKVLDVTRHAQFLGALAYHWDSTNLPIVVDFYGKSCGPCRAIAPVYDMLAATFKGKAVFLKVDTAAVKATSTLLGVRSLPTFMFFVKGRAITEAQFSGADQNKLATTLTTLATQAQREGVYANKVFTEKKVTAFLEALGEKKPGDPSATAKQLLADNVNKPAKLARELQTAYGGVPKASRSKQPAGGIGSDVQGWFELAKGLLGLAEQAVDDARAGAGAAGEDAVGEEEEEEEDPADEPMPADVTEDPGAVVTGETLFGGVAFMSTAFYQKTARAADPEQVVIIGGGPAGLSAAIYAARAGLNPLVISPTQGGQLLGKGVGVENYPGIMTGEDRAASGETVVQMMRSQAASFGTAFLNAKLTSSRFAKGPPFTFELASTNPMEPAFSVSSRAVILATGSNSRWLGIPGEEDFKGKGVTSCATCDGHLYRGKKVMVVGGGDTAMEDALVLARTSESVVLVHRRDTFRACKTLADAVKAHEKITIKWDTEVVSFEGTEAGISHVSTKNTKSGAKDAIEVEAVFIAIGHDPNTGMFGEQLETDEAGYLWVEPRATATKIPGIFACGDVADNVYRQAVTSAGTGAMAALDAERWLSTQR